MWTIAAANKKLNGPLGSYNGLTDIHLAHFFSTPSRKLHLKSAKLIKSDGTIVPDDKVKMTSLQYEKKKKMYDILASTVIQNAAHKESSWNKKLCNYLEDVSKMEKVEKMKGSSRKNIKSHNKNETFTTLPHLRNLNINDWNRSKACEKVIFNFQRSTHSSCKCWFNDTPCLHSAIAKLKRTFSAIETSPYAPLYDSHAKLFHSNSRPQTTGSQKKKKKVKNTVNFKLKPFNPNAMNKLQSSEITHDRCKISLLYHGHTPLTKSLILMKEDVLIRQQHCGGTSVVVYTGQVAPNDILTFTSLTHVQNTFSLIIFLDGIRYLKLSSCCVYRYLPGKRLGGTSGSFSLKSIHGGKPCAACQCRQIETCSKDIQLKLMCSDNSLSLKQGESRQIHIYETGKNIQDTMYSSHEDIKCQENIETEESDNSISENINSQSKEFVRSFENTVINNEAIDEEILEEPNVLVNEDMHDTTDYNSETSSIVESVTNYIRPEIKPYASESSDEEEVKQHVILASVHGSPNGSL